MKSRPHRTVVSSPMRFSNGTIHVLRIRCRSAADARIFCSGSVSISCHWASQPAVRGWQTTREHFRFEAHGLVDDSRVKVHIGIQLARDEIFIFERDSLQFEAISSLGFPPVTANTFSDTHLMILARGS